MFEKFIVLVIAFVAVIAFSASSAFAQGQCGGSVSSWKGYYKNLQKYGAVGQAAQVNKSAGYSSTDGSYKEWLKERVIVTRVHKSVVITNYGCNSSGLFGAGKKRLTKGWRVLVALPAKYSKKDISTKKRKGYKAVIVRAKLVGQATCSNPGGATVTVKIYVKKHKKHRGHKKDKTETNTQTNTNTPPPMATCQGTVVAVAGQAVCQVQSNSNSTTQSGETHGQGSPVININQTTQVNVQQNQGQQQGQQQQQTTPPPSQTPTCPQGTQWNGTECSKVGTSGQGSGSPGEGSGSGSGGSAGPSSGSGASCRLPDGSVGYIDQFGYCNAY